MTQISFSPCGKYLLSGSRDRTWHLFEASDAEDASEGKFFKLIANTDKKTSVHQRLIWSCCWSHDSRFFATGSRDKKIVIWSKKANLNAASINSETSDLGEYAMACSSPLLLESPVTALTFAKSFLPSTNKKYIIAAGLESGKIVVLLWDSTLAETEWNKLRTLDITEAHHKTVKRLKFRPLSSLRNEHLLASCGDDHIVKLHSIKFNEQ